MDSSGLFVVLVVVIIIIGIGAAIAKQAQIDDLRQHGKWILATVQDVEHKTRTSVTGTPPNQVWHTHRYYIVQATWTDPATGIGYAFSSDHLSSRPRYEPGDDVPVLVDPNDYTRYHIEI